MTKFGIAPSPSGTRRKLATAFAAAGALLLSSGMVVMTAAPAAADNTVAVCHATGSDTNPYNLMWVDASSTDAGGHLGHVTDPEFKWGTKGAWWNGTWYEPGTPKPDIIQGATPELCGLPGTKGPIITTPDVEFVDPKCNIDLAINFTNDDKVIYTVSGTQAPGGTVTVTAEPEAGYAFPRNAETTWSHEFDPAPTSCDGVLNPNSPTLTLPRCDGPGQRVNLSWTMPNGPAGITYSQPVTTSTSFSMTATIVDGVSEFPLQADMPQHWTRTSDTTATYTRTFVDPGTCVEPVAVLEPYATANSCSVAGVLVLPVPEEGGYSWTGGLDGDGPGTYNLTAVADSGYSLTGQATHTVAVKAAGVGLNCPGGDNPSVPVETPVEDLLVTPLVPSSIDANCSRDGRLVVPAQPAGVLVDQTGTAPGDVTFTFTPADGYAFPEGTDTEVTVTVPAQLTGDDCIQGVETSRPKPQPGTNSPVNDGPGAQPVKGDAEVLGEQAVAVPTAVAAGLGDTMTAPSAIGGPQLAQALVAAGLLMLLAGGATGLGRRTRGAHES